jgi:RNA polymerase sigma-70 factor (ECF subfamily)
MLNIEEASKLSDEELVVLTLENQNYFLFIINRYKTKLFNYIRRISNFSPEDTEDLLQEIFLKIYLNLNGFNQDLKFSSWIYSIAHNQVISGYRKFKARPEGHAVNLNDNLAKNLISDLNITRSADLKILQKNIFKILDELEPEYREVLVLKFLEEKNYEEISDIIKKPMGTVASRINKAKLLFKEELARQKIKL